MTSRCRATVARDELQHTQGAGQSLRRRRVPGRSPELSDEVFDLAAPTARFGELQGTAGDIAGVGQPPVPLQDGGQPVQHPGCFRWTTSRGEDIRPTMHRPLVGRRPVQGGRVGSKRLVGTAEPGQDAPESDVRQGPVWSDRCGLAVGGGGGVQPTAERGYVTETERVLVSLVGNLGHPPPAPARISTRSAFCTCRRFSD